MGLAALPKIAVLASGRGSNFEAIAKAIDTGLLQAEIVLVASDRGDALVLEKARSRGLETLVQKDQGLLAQALREKSAEYVVLAGFMRILTAKFIEGFRDPRGFARIVNIHPSLLPAFPGLDSYRQAFEHGAKMAGCTVHFVDAGVDTGPICAQKSFSIVGCADVAEVERQGLTLEHELYPQTLNWILRNAFDVNERGGRLHVQPH
jgi:phosphoribosylglycinamide formyltransferase-1